MTEVTQIVAASGDEPLSHQLFREAWYQRDSNPRSALLIGVAAVEVATKECIATLAPEAEWLVRELPSPPVERILREYVPTLPASHRIEGQVLPPPADLLDELKKAVGWRNSVAHGGQLHVSSERVESFLETTAHDILWLLRYYSGDQWALDHLRETTRADLRAP